MEDEIRGLLPRYYDGELSEEAARRVELHLPGCSKCRTELYELRMLSAMLAPAAEPASAVAADEFWQAFRPKLADPERGVQRAPVPWRAWLPGLLLLTVYGLLAALLTTGPLLARLTGIQFEPPALPLPLPLLALDWLPLPGVSLSNLLLIGLLGSAGVLYLVWLGFLWMRHAAEANPTQL